MLEIASSSTSEHAAKPERAGGLLVVVVSMAVVVGGSGSDDAENADRHHRDHGCKFSSPTHESPPWANTPVPRMYTRRHRIKRVCPTLGLRHTSEERRFARLTKLAAHTVHVSHGNPREEFALATAATVGIHTRRSLLAREAAPALMRDSSSDVA